MRGWRVIVWPSAALLEAGFDAGRIGRRAAPDPARLLHHMRNEEVLLGRR